jgi:hypothetical protein
VRRVALHGLDQVRDEIVAALELHVDAAPGLVDLVARADERVPGRDDPDDQQDEPAADRVEDRVAHAGLIGCLRASLERWEG